MKLTAENVEAVFVDCLFAEDEEKSNAVIVEGVTHSFGFNPAKLNKNKKDIYDMLKQLPASFQKESGGGYSFLEGCNDKEGKQWTGLHMRMEQLFCLGIATEQAVYCLPRENWSVLPGGMPYLVVN